MKQHSRTSPCQAQDTLPVLLAGELLPTRVILATEAGCQHQAWPSPQEREPPTYTIWHSPSTW